MLPITNPGASAALKSDVTDDEHIVHHRDADRAALLTALGALDPDPGLAAIVDALVGTLAVSATALPLPSGAATQATLASILAKIIAAPATEAKQDALKASVDALLAATRPITGHFLVAPGASALTNPTRRIVAGGAGTLTCTVGGVSVSYTVVAGQTLDVVATVISAAPAGTVGQF